MYPKEDSLDDNEATGDGRDMASVFGVLEGVTRRLGCTVVQYYGDDHGSVWMQVEEKHSGVGGGSAKQ
jgi:hypothetical protein